MKSEVPSKQTSFSMNEKFQTCSVCRERVYLTNLFEHMESASHRDNLHSLLNREFKRMEILQRAVDEASLNYVLPDPGNTTYYCCFCNSHIQQLDDQTFG